MSERDIPKLGHIASKALELLQQHPEGLSMSRMRDLLDAGADSQEHFNRRVREIRKYFVLDRRIEDGVSIYMLGGRRTAPTTDSGHVSEKLRAAVLHAAHGKCQMCGQNVKQDGIKLQADHRIPQSWGGSTTLENLWALCEACNRGKRNYFASFDDEKIRLVVNLESVHERIAEFLRLHMPNSVPAYAIEFVANAKDQQLDWRKRLRELRYPPIGLEILVSKKKDKKGVQSYYKLLNWRDLPDDHVKIIKDFERARKGT